jgi:hypothetical protein
MMKCPFCQFENEDGALFCEQCKSDLGSGSVLVGEAGEVPMAALVEETAPGRANPPVPVAVALDNPFNFMASPEPVAAARAEPAAPGPTAATPSAPPTIPVTSPLTPSPAAAAPAADSGRIPTGAQPKLVVLRGQKINMEFPLYEGHNFIGRADEKPVDIDLEDQEPPDRIWSSRQHAVITFEEGHLVVEDLNSANGTFVNRARIHPGQKRPLRVSDVIQIGTVQLKVRI